MATSSIVEQISQLLDYKFNLFQGNLQQEILQVSKELNNVRQELGKELNDVRQELNDVRQELGKELNDVLQEFNDVRQELNDVRKELKGVRKELNDVRKELGDVRRIQGKIMEALMRKQIALEYGHSFANSMLVTDLPSSIKLVKDSISFTELFQKACELAEKLVKPNIEKFVKSMDFESYPSKEEFSKVLNSRKETEFFKKQALIEYQEFIRFKNTPADQQTQFLATSPLSIAVLYWTLSAEKDKFYPISIEFDCTGKCQYDEPTGTLLITVAEIKSSTADLTKGRQQLAFRSKYLEIIAQLVFEPKTTSKQGYLFYAEGGEVPIMEEDGCKCYHKRISI